MKAKLYKTTLSLLLAALLSHGVQAQYNLLWVGDETNSVDSALIEFLEGKDYEITVISSETFKVAPYDTEDVYADFDAIFISEIVGSGDVVNFKNAGFPIPCVTTEGYAARVDRWDLLTDNDSQFKQLPAEELGDDVKTIITTAEDHYITREYGAEAEIVWTTKEDNVDLGVTGFMLDENVEDVINLAEYKLEAMGSDFPTLWAIPEGAEIISSSTTIDNKIVIFGVIGPGLGKLATDDFNNIILRSLEWVTDNEQEPPESIEKVKRSNFTVGPNPTTGIVNVSFSLPKAGNVIISIYDITGKRIHTINSDHRIAGKNKLKLDLTGWSSGQYFYEIVTDSESFKGKIIKK